MLSRGEDRTAEATETAMMPIRPVTRTKTQARDNYDRISRWYDCVEGAAEQRFRNAGLELLHADIDEAILELGMGTGHAMLALAQTVGGTNKGHVTGIDLAPGMVAITKQRLENAGLLDRVTLICDDATTHSLEPSSFDGVFMSFFLELLDTPEIPIVLEAVKKSLKPGGRLVVVSLSKENTRMVRLYEWFHDRMPVLVDCRPIFVEKSLRDAGFFIQETKRMYMWGLPVDITLAAKQ